LSTELFFEAEAGVDNDDDELPDDEDDVFFCLSNDARRSVLVTTFRTVMLAVAVWNLCLGSCVVYKFQS
jgi:hypothetical protein